MRLSDIWGTIKAEARELVETARDLRTADWRSWLEASRGMLGVGTVRWAINALNERAFAERFGQLPEDYPIKIQFFGFAPVSDDATDGICPDAEPTGVYCSEHKCDMGSCTLLHGLN